MGKLQPIFFIINQPNRGFCSNLLTFIVSWWHCSSPPLRKTQFFLVWFSTWHKKFKRSCQTIARLYRPWTESSISSSVRSTAPSAGEVVDWNPGGKYIGVIVVHWRNDRIGWMFFLLFFLDNDWTIEPEGLMHTYHVSDCGQPNQHCLGSFCVSNQCEKISRKNIKKKKLKLL